MFSEQIQSYYLHQEKVVKTFHKNAWRKVQNSLQKENLPYKISDNTLKKLKGSISNE